MKKVSLFLMMMGLIVLLLLAASLSEYLRLCSRFMDLAHVHLSHHLVHRRSRLVLEKLISDES